jgi:hypothetical protein
MAEIGLERDVRRSKRLVHRVVLMVRPALRGTPVKLWQWVWLDRSVRWQIIAAFINFAGAIATTHAADWSASGSVSARAQLP